jgi:hypothetical protein
MNHLLVDIVSTYNPNIKLKPQNFVFLNELAKKENLIITPEIEDKLFEAGRSIMLYVRSKEFQKEMISLSQKCKGKVSSKKCNDLIKDHQNKIINNFAKTFKNPNTMEGGFYDRSMRVIRNVTSRGWNISILCILIILELFFFFALINVFVLPIYYGVGLTARCALDFNTNENVNEECFVHNDGIINLGTQYIVNLFITLTSLTASKFFIVRKVNINGFEWIYIRVNSDEDIDDTHFDDDDIDDYNNGNDNQVVDVRPYFNRNRQFTYAFNDLPVDAQYSEETSAVGITNVEPYTPPPYNLRSRNQPPLIAREVNLNEINRHPEAIPVLELDFEIDFDPMGFDEGEDLLDEDPFYGGKRRNKSRRKRTRKGRKSRKGRHNKTKRGRKLCKKNKKNY